MDRNKSWSEMYYAEKEKVRILEAKIEKLEGDKGKTQPIQVKPKEEVQSS